MPIPVRQIASGAWITEEPRKVSDQRYGVLPRILGCSAEHKPIIDLSDLSRCGLASELIQSQCGRGGRVGLCREGLGSGDCGGGIKPRRSVGA